MWKMLYACQEINYGKDGWLFLRWPTIAIISMGLLGKAKT